MYWRKLFGSSSDQALKFYPPSFKNGIPTISPPSEILEAGILDWKLSIVGQFLGPAPNFMTLQRIIETQWRKALQGSRLQVSIAGTNLYIFSFTSKVARDWVLENGPWHILNKPLILRKWEPNLKRLNFNLTKIPIWVHLYNVPLELFSQIGLSYIASGIRVPISMDSVTASKTRLEFAKICVEISVNDDIPKHIDVILQDGSTSSIFVEIPWMPPRCRKCKTFGHNDKNCLVTQETEVIGGIKLLQDPNSTDAPRKEAEKVNEDNSELTSTDIPAEPKTAEIDNKVKLPNPSVLIEDDHASVPKRVDESLPIIEGSQKKSCIASKGVAEIVKELKSKKKEKVEQSKSSIVEGEDILCLLETRVKVQNSKDIIDSKLANWNVCSNYECAVNRRIWVLWKKRIDLTIIQVTDQTLTAKGECCGIPFVISTIYGCNDGIIRRQLWHQMQELDRMIGHLPWILDGSTSEMKEFEDITQDLDLHDHPFIGPLFTWSNKKAETYLARKLDRVLINTNWELSSIEEAELLFLKQKEKVQWIKEGDKCSKFFHSAVAVKIKKETIQMLIDDHGARLESFDSMDVDVLSFFTDLIGKSDPTVKNIDKKLLKDILNYSLPQDSASSLVKVITSEEIKEAIFSQGNDKAPGPDGYTPYFFKFSWSIVGEDVINAIKYFFQNSSLLPAFNETTIALIPKMPTPSKVKDFRPISCCSVIYMAITKIIVKRLSSLISGMVSLNQTAFIKGRSIVC
ncbi:uncharacterized protein LOC120135690 [Hibiscus syriacus]|uniref:uncharacterized protein LOC120135690 n=1 Tax=Hibiscus syriacus TaxID=106335 RepID=UPI001921E224|nr:uncharacterized protein LOC120135690 [Hibiscus syriacus]